MADLTVNICGLEFKNPILPAAGPPTWNGAAPAPANMFSCIATGRCAKTWCAPASRRPGGGWVSKCTPIGCAIPAPRSCSMRAAG